MLSAGFAVGIVFISLIPSEGNASEFRKALESGTFLQAFEACNEFGDGWALPSPNLSREELARAMSTTNLSSAWMGIQREVGDWTWVNGTSNTNFTRTEPGRNCAQLDVSNQKLFAASCADQGIGFLCELQAGEVCPSDILFRQACFSLGETRGILACESKNWFHAQSFCRKVAWRLVIPDARKIEAVTRLIADRRIITECSYLYIGLHRERWLSKKPRGGTEEVRKYEWAANEPFGSNSQCTEATKDGTWKVRDCDTRTAVLCQNDTPLLSEVYKGDPSPFGIVAITAIVELIIAVLLVILLRAKCQHCLTTCLCLEIYSRVSTELDYHDETKNTALPDLKKKNGCTSILLFLYKGNGNPKVDKKEYPSNTVPKYDRQPTKEETLKDIRLQIDLVHYTSHSPVLTKVQSDNLLDYLLRNKEAVDIAYLPGMELTQTSLSRIQHLRKGVGLFCLAKNDTVGDTAAETIAIGITETEYGRRNPDIIANGLLDISCTGNISEPGLGEEVDPRVAHILVLAAKRMWQQKPNVPNNITADLRCHLIDSARGQHQTEGHHPYIGFGLLDDPGTMLISQDAASPGYSALASGDLVQNTASEKTEEKIVIVLCSTGIDAGRPKLKPWEIRPLEESRRGDEDTARHIGTSSVEIMTDSLTKLGVTPSKVVIYDAHVVKHGWQKDWAHFEHILNMLVEKKPDIVLITSGLGYPDNLKDSSVPELLYDIKEFSVVATSSVLCRPDNVMADFPSDSVISVRVDKDPTTAPACVTGYAKGATVDFVIQGQEVWEGGARTGAIAAKILIQSRTVGDAIGISQIKLQKTDMMHEILVQLSEGRKSHDEIHLLENERIIKKRIEANLSKYYDAAVKAKRYWAGKNID